MTRLAVFILLAVLTGAARQASVVRIADSGAAGDGVTDDTAAIQSAIDRSDFGATIDFGTGKTWLVSRTLELQPERRYSGSSTIKLASVAPLGTPLLRTPYAKSENVTLEGLTLDAGQVGGILHLGSGGGNSLPAINITVRNCVFRGSRPEGDISDSSVYAPVGLFDSSIEGNRFAGCSTCLYLINPRNLTISQNDFDGTTGGNAISVVVHESTLIHGDGLVIARNTGRKFRRMGIEVIGSGKGRLNRPVIAFNDFSDWDTQISKDPYGISVAFGADAEIVGNKLSGGRSGYGIEVGVSGALVTKNTVSGFPIGIVVQGPAGTTIEENTLSGQTDSGIVLSNAGNNQRTRIVNNTIINAKKFGIGMLPNNYQDSFINGNRITREGGFWPEDAVGETPFVGIKLDAGLQGPVVVRGNEIVQTAATPPAKFQFWGFGVFGGYPGSVLDRNIIESRSRTPTGTGIVVWYSGLLNATSVENNHFVNLVNMASGSTGGPLPNSNQARGVRDPDPNLGLKPGDRVGAPSPGSRR
jgi:parallel beta-helix repeat protein